MKSKRSKSGTKKYGRNKQKCDAYRKAHKHEKSHIKRLSKHLVKHPRDEQAKDALRRYECVKRV